MQLPALVEQLAEKRFRASIGEPFGFAAEGSSRAEALSKLEDLIGARLRGGAAVVPLEIEVHDDPWFRMAGSLDPDDPLVQEWMQTMKENRKKNDEDPNYL